MAKVALFAAGAVGIALAAWPLVSWYEVRKLEKPHHTVIKTLLSKKVLWYVEPVVQLRQYSPYLVAEVTVESDNLHEALRSGFTQVAGFIFGDNVSANSNGAEKVAMTSPVISEKQKGSSEKVAMTSPVTAEMEGGKYLVSFVMPSKYTQETLPKPNNENVKIKEVPKRTFATYAWRGGSPSEEEVQDKTDKLFAILKQHDITVKDTTSTHLWQYYPPFAPNWLRLQEVLLPVEFDGEADAEEPTAESGTRVSIVSSEH
ncbi:hypothetical protein WJX79_005523 [Trebouxia sp. C0005]|nr:MAG: SOUL heme-binding [Trebouxia sp. A1-2]